jgi:hypothetical protein
MRSTDKELVHYSLGTYVAQTAPGISDMEGIPQPSVRRILRELVAAGRVQFIKADLFGFPGYVRVRRG